MSFISLGVLGSRSEPGAIGGILAVFKYSVGDPLDGYTFARSSSATYTDASGLIQTVNNDVARDQHFIAGQQYLLLEPSRTNQLWYSTNLNNWSFQSAILPIPTKTAVSASSPTGQVAVMYRATFPASSTTGSYSEFYGRFIAGTNLVYSIYLKGNVGGEKPYLFVQKNDGSYLETQPTLTTAWQFFSLPVGNSPIQTVASLGVDLRDTAQTPTSAMSLLGWGRQIEDGGYATSLIVTVGVNGTRSLDALSLLTPGGAGQTGTLYEKYFDLATQTIIETVRGFTTTATFVPTVGRAWISWKFALGIQSLGTMQGV